MSYQHRNANKGSALEELLKRQNLLYLAQKVANIQKISTPWKVIRSGDQIISAFPEEKSTVDFRGTVRGGYSISFDAKETEDERGLPLKDIAPHQIEYMRTALELGEITFIVCWILPRDRQYVIDGAEVLRCWDEWKQNPRKRGYCYIPEGQMKPIDKHSRAICDYLSALTRKKEREQRLDYT